jgi:hypothetical protein
LTLTQKVVEENLIDVFLQQISTSSTPHCLQSSKNLNRARTFRSYYCGYAYLLQSLIQMKA